MADAPKILKTDSLRDSFPKLNSAIDNSNEALKESTKAKIDSAYARTTATKTQTQLNNIIIESGTSDAEVIQARGSATVLNERLDGLDDKVAETEYYDEITYSKYRDSVTGTDYFITHIPHRDKNGNLIELKHGYQNDLLNSGNGETARSFAVRHNVSAAVNASIWNVNTGLIYGIQIQDGVIQQDIPHASSYTLGIKADNTLKAYPPSNNAQSLLDDGVVNAVTGFFPMIQNNIAVSPTVYNSAVNASEFHPRQVIAQLSNLDIIFLTSAGRTKTDKGLTYDDMIRILTERGVSFAYCLDGGGSTQTVVRGVMVNNPVDDNGKTERNVWDFLYVKKPVAVPDKLKTVSSDVGNVNKRVSDLVADLRTKVDMLEGYIRLKGDVGFDLRGIESWEGDQRQGKFYLQKESVSYYDYITGQNIFKASLNGDIQSTKGILGTFLKTVKSVNSADTISESGIYWIQGSSTGAPNTVSSWAILHIQYDSINALQLAIPFHATQNNLMSRRTDPNTTGAWLAWRQI